MNSDDAGSSSSAPRSDTRKRRVPNAQPVEPRSASDAYPLLSSPTEFSTTATIAAGKAASSTKISPNVIQWAAARRISARTLERLGVASDTRYFPEAGKHCEVIAFPYKRGSETVNTKYRAIHDKLFQQTVDGELRFWGLDDALRGPKKQIIVCEGEMDRAAFVEAGWGPEDVLSVPNGAPVRSSENPEEQDRYRYVDAALKEGLAAGKRFVLATDNDPPGMALRQDLVRLLGPARCWFIDWPTGIKDANEFLIRYGAEDLQTYLSDGAREWPVEGLYRLSELPEIQPLETWSPGFPEWEGKLRFARKTLSVVTGWPGSGKSVLTQQLWYQIARDFGITVAIAAFETRPKPHVRRNMRQFMYGLPQSELSDSQIQYADSWIDDHFLWLVHPNRKPTLRWLLDMAEVAVIRNNARVIQIDPWNKLESERPDHKRETDWIGECLDECLDFANDLNVHLQIVAHPSKPENHAGYGRHPQLGDVAGSAHWWNKVDQGLSVFRPKVFENGKRCTEAALYVLKARFEELGYPCRLNLDFDLATRRYRSIDYETRLERELAS